MKTNISSSLIRYWTPQYWPTWILIGLIRTNLLLPLRWQITIGKCIGRYCSRLLPEKRHIASKNIEVCFPEFSAKEREGLVDKNFEAMGAAFSEIAMGWFGKKQSVQKIFKIDGQEHLAEALEKGRGVILFCGHFTSIEILYPALKPFCPRLTAMYKPMRNKLADEIMLRGRLRSFDELFSKYSVRNLINSLNKNSVVIHLTDQCYTGKHSALVPFFSEPAMTSTATSRLLKLSGATLLRLFYKRREDDTGYIAQICPPLKNFPTNDATKDTAILMKELETYIRTCPEQYAWIHKRFKGRPKPYIDIYNDAGRS
ncbi:MAG: lipid A biosynthesis acyltransferase [Rhodospirillaceae bacterium]|nr:lipid A biosynthesis acyltransferase [Rhodospirillaceae bacterium]